MHPDIAYEIAQQRHAEDIRRAQEYHRARTARLARRAERLVRRLLADGVPTQVPVDPMPLPAQRTPLRPVPEVSTAITERDVPEHTRSSATDLAS